MKPLEVLVCSFLLLCVCCAGGDQAPIEPPNVILISIDCLNQRQFATAIEAGYVPALAALADDSVTFTRAYAHAPWMTPSHMSMLTGLYPSQHGRDIPHGMMLRWNEYYPRLPDFETIADRLRLEGYETAAFVGKGSISGVYGLEQGFDLFMEHPKHTETGLSDLISVIEDTREWLAARTDRPFFLFIHTFDLHEPLPHGFDSDRKAIAYIDEYLTKLFDQLRSQGLYDSSLIMFTGDHGSNMIATDGKCCVHGAGHYEENLRVPLLLKPPGGDASRRDDRIARHVDLFPTVMEASGITARYAGPGVSLLSRTSRELLSFSEADGRCAMRRGLTGERYKYIYTLHDETQALMRQDESFFDDNCDELCRDLPTEELYDLREDPFERRNLLDGPLDGEREAWLNHLRNEMATHLDLPRLYSESDVGVPLEGLDDGEREELKESLRTLGYIQ